MRISAHEGYTIYYEGDYSLEVHTKGAQFLKHKCPASTSVDSCYDQILPEELEDNQCRYCDELNIPENLQALYYLYQYGNQ